MHLLLDTSFSLYRGVQPRRLLSFLGVCGENFPWRHRLPGIRAPTADLFSGPHAVATATVMNNQCRQTVASASVCLLRPQQTHCGAGVHFPHASSGQAGTPLDESFVNQYVHLVTSLLPLLHPPPTSIPVALEVLHVRRICVRTCAPSGKHMQRKAEGCVWNATGPTFNSCIKQLPARNWGHWLTSRVHS